MPAAAAERRRGQEPSGQEEILTGSRELGFGEQRAVHATGSGLQLGLFFLLQLSLVGPGGCPGFSQHPGVVHLEPGFDLSWRGTGRGDGA